MIPKETVMYAIYHNTLKSPRFRAVYISDRGWEWGWGWRMNSQCYSFFCKWGIVLNSRRLL